MADLKPCPFCGETKKLSAESNVHDLGDVLLSTATDVGDVWSVECGKCDASGPAGDTEAEAIERWNRRAQDVRGEAHTDHPSRVWDRTCPACSCQAELLAVDSAFIELDREITHTYMALREKLRALHDRVDALEDASKALRAAAGEPPKEPPPGACE